MNQNNRMSEVETPMNVHAASLASAFFAQAKRNPSKLAIACQGDHMSYQALANMVVRWSQAMELHGVKRGDHVAVLLPNGIPFVALMLVAAHQGLVLVPLSTSLMADAIHTACRAANVKHVVTQAALIELLMSAELDFSEVDGVWLSIDKPVAANLNGHSVHAWPDWMRANATEDAATNEQKYLSSQALEDDAYILTMTSGSTGAPKPIVLTQGTKYYRANAAVGLYGVTAEDVTLAATPLYHSLAERLVLIPLLTGGTSVLMRSFSVAEWLRHVHDYGVTFTIAVSSQLKQIASQIQVADPRVVSLRCLVSSSALLTDDVKAELLDKFACDVHECYGASEIAIASNLDPLSAKMKLQSVGRPAIGVDIKILDNQGQEAPTGEVGEIVCKTPMLFGGYYQRPELTEAAMWHGYFKTGDLGKLDHEGYLHYLGRKKDLIVSGGINVYPADIEAVLHTHPAVAEAAAFAYPDEKLGEVVAVAVVLSSVAQPLETDAESVKKAHHLIARQLKFYCIDRLADFQQPRHFFVVENLPKNSLGKLMKYQLAQQFHPDAKQAVTDALASTNASVGLVEARALVA